MHIQHMHTKYRLFVASPWLDQIKVKENAHWMVFQTCIGAQCMWFSVMLTFHPILVFIFLYYSLCTFAYMVPIIQPCTSVG